MCEFLFVVRCSRTRVDVSLVDFVQVWCINFLLQAVMSAMSSAKLPDMISNMKRAWLKSNSNRDTLEEDKCDAFKNGARFFIFLVKLGPPVVNDIISFH